MAGSTRCSFCDKDESIKHLFLDYPLAKILWQTVHLAFNITPPNTINTLFGTWLDGLDSETARHIRVGVCALLWAVWNYRNHLVFNRITKNSFIAGYLTCYYTHPYVVATHSDGGQGVFGYWIYPLGDGSTGYIQPVWMAVM